MRILHIIKKFDFGGAENYLCDLANSLNKSGNKIYIIARPGRQRLKLNKNITFIPIWLKDLFLPFILLYICYLVKRNKIQLIHAHQRFPMFIATIAGKICKIPVVATIHGTATYDLGSKFVRKHSSKIIFVSEYVKNIANKFPEIHQKKVLIPNGVSINVNKNIIRDNGQIIYLSRIDRHHSEVILLIIHKILPDLLKEFPFLSFHIIGEGRYLGKVKEEVEKFNFESKKEICFIKGYQADVNFMIQQADLVLGVGRVAIEALANGTSVISVNKKRMGALLTMDNLNFYLENNFVAVGNHPPIKDNLLFQLRNFFKNKSYFQEQTYLIQKNIDHKLNISNTASQIEIIYKELITQS
jgi:glycosyltransferase involved in cell wall biosynthesis